jgi:hypothetical protein
VLLARSRLCKTSKGEISNNVNCPTAANSLKALFPNQGHFAIRDMSNGKLLFSLRLNSKGQGHGHQKSQKHISGNSSAPRPARKTVFTPLDSWESVRQKAKLFEDDKPFPLHVNHSQSCQGQHRTSLPHDATLLFKVADHVMSGHCFATLSTQLLSIGTNSEALEFLGVKILCIMCQGRPEAKCPPHSTFNLTLKYWS